MKQETKKTGQVSEQMMENVNTAVELSNKAANVMLESAVKSAELTNNFYRNSMNIGLDVTEAGIGVARNYFSQMNRINQEWIGLFNKAGEKTITSVSDNFRKPVNEVIQAGADVVANASAQAKQAAK